LIYLQLVLTWVIFVETRISRLISCKKITPDYIFFLITNERSNQMGEARRRMEMGYQPEVTGPGVALNPPPRYPNGNQPLQISADVLKNATPRLCGCGCKYFVPVVAVYTVSALVSPIGKELTAQQPVLVCRDCGEMLKIGG
jgi:hypothetical protein